MVDELAVLNEIPFDRTVLHGELPDLTLAFHEVEVHETAYVGPLVVIYKGIDKPTRIGARSMIEAGSIIGHDVQIEEDVEIASLSGIGGYAIIRKGARLGTGVIVQPYVCVGAGARVGSGAVVTKHVKAGETVAGVPATPLRPWDSNHLKCGCSSTEVWDGCPHHGSNPAF